MNDSRIHFVEGSIFDLERSKPDAVAIFVPAGLTALRVDTERFLAECTAIPGTVGEFKAYHTKRGTVVIVAENRDQKLYDSGEMMEMVDQALSIFAAAKCTNVMMNGIRLGEGPSERLMVMTINAWLQFRPEVSLKKIELVDLRGGFNKAFGGVNPN